jgi:hypothetical protein
MDKPSNGAVEPFSVTWICFMTLIQSQSEARWEVIIERLKNYNPAK